MTEIREMISDTLVVPVCSWMFICLRISDLGVMERLQHYQETIGGLFVYLQQTVESVCSKKLQLLDE
jgi:hypothetical protein